MDEMILDDPIEVEEEEDDNEQLFEVDDSEEEAKETPKAEAKPEGKPAKAAQKVQKEIRSKDVPGELLDMAGKLKQVGLKSGLPEASAETMALGFSSVFAEELSKVRSEVGAVDEKIFMNSQEGEVYRQLKQIMPSLSKQAAMEAALHYGRANFESGRTQQQQKERATITGAEHKVAKALGLSDKDYWDSKQDMAKGVGRNKASVVSETCSGEYVMKDWM